MITLQDIERAETVLNEAEEALADLGPARRRLLPNRETGAIRAAAEGRVGLAADQLEALTEQRAAEQAALADRPDRERAAGKYVAEVSKDLTASRKRVTAAAAAAQAALVELVDAGGAHNELVTRVAAELDSQGLALDDGAGIEHETGGTRGAVRIKGAWWLSAGDPATLAVWALHRVAVARLRRAHGLIGYLRFFGRRDLLDARTDGLLDAVPDVPGAELREMPRVRCAQVTGAPVALSDWARKDEMRRREVTYAKPNRSLMTAEDSAREQLADLQRQDR